MISDPSVNKAKDVNKKHCDDNYETKSIIYDIDDDDDSTCEFVKPRTPWYGSTVVH